MSECIPALAESGAGPVIGLLIAAAFVIAMGAVLLRSHRTTGRTWALGLLVAAALVGAGLTTPPAAQAAACETPAPVVTASATPTPEATETPTPTSPLTVEFIRQCDGESQVVVRVTNSSADTVNFGLEQRDDEGNAAGDGYALAAYGSIDIGSTLAVNRTYTVTGPDGFVAEQRFEACGWRISGSALQECSTGTYTAWLWNGSPSPRDALLVTTADGVEVDRQTVTIAAEGAATATIAVSGPVTVTISDQGVVVSEQTFATCPVRDVVGMIAPVCAVMNTEGARVQLLNDNTIDVTVEIDVTESGAVVSTDSVTVPASGNTSFLTPKSVNDQTITVRQDGRTVLQSTVPGCAV